MVSAARAQTVGRDLARKCGMCESLCRTGTRAAPPGGQGNFDASSPRASLPRPRGASTSRAARSTLARLARSSAAPGGRKRSYSAAGTTPRRSPGCRFPAYASTAPCSRIASRTAKRETCPRSSGRREGPSGSRDRLDHAADRASASARAARLGSRAESIALRNATPRAPAPRVDPMPSDVRLRITQTGVTATVRTSFASVRHRVKLDKWQAPLPRGSSRTLTAELRAGFQSLRLSAREAARNRRRRRLPGGSRAVHAMTPEYRASDACAGGVS